MNAAGTNQEERVLLNITLEAEKFPFEACSTKGRHTISQKVKFQIFVDLVLCC